MWLFPRQKDTKEREKLKKGDTFKRQHSIWEGEREKRGQQKTKLSNSEWTQDWLEQAPQAYQLHTDVIHLLRGTPWSERYPKEKLGSWDIKYIHYTK